MYASFSPIGKKMHIFPILLTHIFPQNFCQVIVLSPPRQTSDGEGGGREEGGGLTEKYTPLETGWNH